MNWWRILFSKLQASWYRQFETSCRDFMVEVSFFFPKFTYITPCKLKHCPFSFSFSFSFVRLLKWTLRYLRKMSTENICKTSEKSSSFSWLNTFSMQKFSILTTSFSTVQMTTLNPLHIFDIRLSTFFLSLQASMLVICTPFFTSISMIYRTINARWWSPLHQIKISRPFCRESKSENRKMNYEN